MILHTFALTAAFKDDDDEITYFSVRRETKLWSLVHLSTKPRAKTDEQNRNGIWSH